MYIKITLLISIIFGFLSPAFAANSSKAINLFPADQAPSYYPAKKPVAKKPVKPDTYSKKQIKHVVTLASIIAADQKKPYFNGFYLGIGAGVGYTHAKVSNTVNDTITYQKAGEAMIENTLPLNAKLGDITPTGQVFLGFGKTFTTKAQRSFYLGGELFGRLYSAKMDSDAGITRKRSALGIPIDKTTFSTAVELKNDYSLGGAIRLGYLPNPKTMFYILAGIDVAEFRYNVQHNFTLTIYDDPAETISYGYSYNSSKWKAGIMPGIGMETMLSDKISLRIQGIYDYYGDMHVKNNVPTVNIPSKYDVKAKSSSEDDIKNISRILLTLDLTYHFNGI